LADAFYDDYDEPVGLIPAQAIAETEAASVDRTYKLDFAAKTISGIVDESEAIRQAILKRLMTDAGVYEIYSDDYGLKVNDLIGLSPGIVRSEIERRITETLLRDDRITAVTNFESTVTGDEMTLSFIVTTIYGIIAVERGYGL